MICPAAGVAFNVLRRDRKFPVVDKMIPLVAAFAGELRQSRQQRLPTERMRDILRSILRSKPKNIIDIEERLKKTR